MSRIVIISNRLPVTIEKQENELVYYPSAGGLATGLKSLDASIPRLWIGWPGMEVKSEKERIKVQDDLASRDLAPVFLSEEEIQLFYEGFSNKTVWPHFHYFTQYTSYEEIYWDAYVEANRKFAEVAKVHIREGDLVWVQDYQLLLLPAMIREHFPKVSIGFFLHIPFPSYEVFRVLPWREEIIQGVLGADQIGFHTFGYMRHFLSAVYRIAGYEHNFGKLTVANRLINVEVFPMGIDYEKYAHPAADTDSAAEMLKVRQMTNGGKLIISIDRLDYTKGIPGRLRAFARFLKNNPQYLGKVTLVLLVVPSRSNVDQYQDLKHQVDELVGELNGAYATFDWVPVKYFYRSLNFAELMALYQEANIAMITPLRDGMNLVAKEFVASKENSKAGVLILSEMAGASDELTEAIIVNPHDLNDMAAAIKRALEMSPSEQRWRLEVLQKKLKKNTVSTWANNFLNEQRKLMEEQDKQSTFQLDQKEKEEVFSAYRQSDRRLIFLDYDGTLMNFDPDPQAVIPDHQLLVTLRQLSRIEGNKVVVNSGRDRDTLDKWLGPLKLDMAAEHGVWIKKNDRWISNPNLSADWKDRVRSVLEDMVDRTPGSFIEEKDYSIAWHYRRVDRDFGEKRVREFRDVLRYLTAGLDLQVLEGNKVVEIKNAGVSKGKATLSWLNKGDWNFVMAVGDDSTDEDMFKVMPPDAYTIKVGLAQSVARYNLLSVEEVRSLLREMVDLF